MFFGKEGAQIMSLYITSLSENHLEDAAALVTARYKALRERVPLLPPRYEEVGTILHMLRDLTGEGSGVVAIRADRLVGFLSGFVIPEFLGKRSIYSPEWANGAELTESRRIYEQMYAHISARWVADGCFTHAISLLGHDREGIECWQWLGFGLATVDGVREPEMVEGIPAQVRVRQASVENAREVAELVAGLQRHMAAAPTFWIHEMEDSENWLAKPGHVAWLAYEAGEAVGCMGLEVGHVGGCEVLQDEKTISVENAYTVEGVRGKGIGTALLNRALEWAKGQGFARVAVDFESMNILATRFWMKWFEPVCYSLIRSIDERVARFLMLPSSLAS
jgi:GNAT superfamily N-acetyltransferase